MGWLKDGTKAICKVTADIFNFPNTMLQHVSDATNEIINVGGDSVFGQISGELHDAVSTAIPAIQSLGFLVCFMFFCMSLLDLATNEQFTFEQCIKFFAKLFLGLLVVGASVKFFDAGINFGKGFSELVSGAFTTGGKEQWDMSDTYYNIIWSSCKEKDLFKALGFLALSLTAILPMVLIVIVMIIVVYVIGFSRIIELNVRGFFLPIGLALLSEDGWKGSGGRYFKKFIALSCQGAVIGVIAQIMRLCMSIATTAMATQIQSSNQTADFDSQLVNDAINGSMSIITVLSNFIVVEVLVIGIGIATISALFKSIQLINDVFGA